NLPPAITGVTGPSGPIALGGPASVAASFTDAGTLDTHTCAFAWNDTPSPTTSAGTVSGTAGNGSCAGSHTYAAAGIYPVGVTVADNGTGSRTASFQYVVVYEARCRFVTGGGWINSPAGAYARDASLAGKVTFGFQWKYGDAGPAPAGDTLLQFHAGNFTFKSTLLDWLLPSRHKAHK